jgi:hypothetical protein
LGGRASEVEEKKSTVAEAFETWTAKSEGEESRNRKVKAQAEAAQDPKQQGFGASCCDAPTGEWPSFPAFPIAFLAREIRDASHTLKV